MFISLGSLEIQLRFEPSSVKGKRLSEDFQVREIRGEKNVCLFFPFFPCLTPVFYAIGEKLWEKMRGGEYFL